MLQEQKNSQFGYFGSCEAKTCQGSTWNFRPCNKHDHSLPSPVPSLHLDCPKIQQQMHSCVVQQKPPVPDPAQRLLAVLLIWSCTCFTSCYIFWISSWPQPLTHGRALWLRPFFFPPPCSKLPGFLFFLLTVQLEWPEKILISLIPSLQPCSIQLELERRRMN